MNKLAAWISLLRPKQMVKQVLVVLPIISLGTKITSIQFLHSLLAAASFSFAAGFVYVLNDFSDVENDKKDPTKRNRPYAAGRVSRSEIVLFASLFFLLAFVLAFSLRSHFLELSLLLVLYICMNVFYSRLKLKQYNLIGLAFVGVGFPLRFVFGCVALKLPVSAWGIVLLFQLALFMLSGKRYQTEKRHSFIQQLDSEFRLDFWLLALVLLGSLFSASYVGFVLSSTEVATWGKGSLLLSTIPLGLGLLRYLEIVTHPEHFKTADATESVVRDRLLPVFAFLYVVILAFHKIIH